MTPEEFCAKLKQENRYAEELAHTVTFLKEERTMVIERRDRNLLETIQNMRAKNIFPLVDKKFGLVFGVGESNHQMMRTGLFRYHNAAGKGDNVPYIDPRTSADEYVFRGMGYFFSSIGGRGIIVASSYVKHPYDEDVFLTYPTISLDEVTLPRRR